MKIEANRMELLHFCKRAARIATEASPIEELRGILLEAAAAEHQMTATVTNFEVSLQGRIKAHVMESGSAVVNAKLLVGMLNLLEGEHVSMQIGPNHVMQLSGGACQYWHTVLPGGGYPKTEIPFPADAVQISGVPTLARLTAFAASEDESNPIMRCVNLMFTDDGLRAVSSDGTRMMMAKSKMEGVGSTSLLMPAKSLWTLAGMVTDGDSLSVSTTGKIIVFRMENFAYSARLMEGTYPNADALLKSIVRNFTILTDAEALWEVLDAIAPIAGSNGYVCLDFSGNRLHASCTCAQGSSSRELEVIPLLGTPNGSYYYHLQSLTECLRALNGTLQLQIAQNGLLLLETQHATCLQNAVRTPATPQKKTKKAPPKAA